MAVAVIGLLAPVTAFGQNGSPAPAETGRIEGRVVDGQTGEPLVGGQVMIASADEIGTVTRPDGTFFIDGVPSGGQRVTSVYLGYRSVTHRVDVDPGRTVEVQFALPVDVVEADAIVATYEREPATRRISRRALQADPIERGLGLPDRVLLRCDGERRFHGVFIEHGRWADHVTVGEIRCESPESRRRPRGVISREDAALLTEEQKAQFAERGYLIRGYNDTDFR